MAQHQSISGTNCFTISRFGAPVEGIVLSRDMGSNPLHPWTPHIKVGTSRVHQDFKSGSEAVMVGEQLIVFKANVFSRVLDSGRSVHTLKSATFNQARGLILKINLGMSQMNNTAMVVNGRNLRLYVGAHGGTLLECQAAEAAVKLEDQEHVTCFFFDGAVRVFKCHEGALYEVPLGTEAMLRERINRAKIELKASTELTGEGRDKKEYSVLMGMVDLLNLTAHFDKRGFGQQMRTSIIRDFFLKTEPAQLNLVHPRLTAILHQIDPALLPLLWPEVSPPAQNVVDMGAERARRDSNRRAKIEHDRQVRLSMKGRPGQVSNTSQGKKNKK